MGDRVVALCNFCEVHGPRVVFVCQETSGINGQRRICNKQFYGDVSSDILGSYVVAIGDDAGSIAASPSDTCDGCRSLNSSKPAYLVNDHERKLSYIGCQFPYRLEVFSRLRCACVRSLSCEACPGRQGPIVFGDPANGYCLCYVFTLKDSKARGFQHSYSIVVVSRQIDELVKNYSTLVYSLKAIVARLQAWSDRVFDRERAESIDRMPQIAASGRAGWVPSGFFLRTSGAGGPCRAVAAPRSLMELTDRPDVFESLHGMFVDVHRTAAVDRMYKLREIDCSSRFGQNGDSLSIDEREFVEEKGDDGDCHICAACTTNVAQSPLFAFKTLTLLYDILGSEAFSLLVYHLLIGNQIVVRSACVCSNRVLLEALKLLLPTGCIKCVESSKEYRDSWEYNLVGLLLVDTDSSRNGDGGRSVSSKTNHVKDSVPPNSISGDSCVILSVEFSPTDTRNGKIDYSNHHLAAPSTMKDRLRSLPRDGYHFRVCCTASASSNNYFDTESPALLQSILNLLSTTFSRIYASDDGAAAGLNVLESLKDEWMRKTKLYYVMSKRCHNNEDDSWRLTFFRISKCSSVDEPILKFWKSGLTRRFKQSVLFQYSSQQQTPQFSNGAKPGEIRIQNGKVHEGLALK